MTLMYQWPDVYGLLVYGDDEGGSNDRQQTPGNKLATNSSRILKPQTQAHIKKTKEKHFLDYTR